MKNVTEDYGKSAGKIWETLNTKGSLTQNNLLKNTRLNEEEFYAAIGWLARENKVYRNGNTYGLGETNLTKHIGKNVKKIWEILNDFEGIDAEYIPKLTNINNKDMYLAIGWLAREGKISGKKVKPKKYQLKFWIRP